LGQLFEPFPDIEIEVERIIPTESSVMPLFWVTGADPTAVEEVLRSGPIVEDVKMLTNADERTL
jgi:hypothetical protein